MTLQQIALINAVHINDMIMSTVLFTFFFSDNGDRVSGYAPSCIGRCHSDGVANVLLQSC